MKHVKVSRYSEWVNIVKVKKNKSKCRSIPVPSNSKVNVFYSGHSKELIDQVSMGIEVNSFKDVYLEVTTLIEVV